MHGLLSIERIGWGRDIMAGDFTEVIGDGDGKVWGIMSRRY